MIQNVLFLLLLLLSTTILIIPSKGIPSTTCTLCPDGNTEFVSDIVIPFTNGQTCGQLSQQAATNITDPTECQQRIQINAGWCQCPNHPPACTICPDGSYPPDSTKVEPFMGFTCLGMDYFERTLQPADCGLKEHIIGLKVGYYCGCPHATPANRCDLCPGGGTVQTTKSVPNFLGGDTCGAVADFFASITNVTLCAEWTAPAQALCCNEGYTPPKCSICPNSSKAVFPDAMAAIPGEGNFTCQALQALSTYVKDPLCAEFQSMVQAACCGTPAMLAAIAQTSGSRSDTIMGLTFRNGIIVGNRMLLFVLFRTYIVVGFLINSF